MVTIVSSPMTEEVERALLRVLRCFWAQQRADFRASPHHCHLFRDLQTIRLWLKESSPGLKIGRLG